MAIEEVIHSGQGRAVATERKRSTQDVFRRWQAQGLPKEHMWWVREREVGGVAWASGLRNREDGQGIYREGGRLRQDVFGKECKGVHWTCFKPVKCKQPSQKAQNLACTDVSMRELKILKAVASWSVLKWKLDGCLGTKPASQSSLSENQEFSVLKHCALQEPHPV